MGAGAIVTGGVGAVGPGVAVLPLEHAASDVSATIRKMKSGIVPLSPVAAQRRGREGGLMPVARPDYEERITVIGSTEAARRAGSTHASNATAQSKE